MACCRASFALTSLALQLLLLLHPHSYLPQHLSHYLLCFMSHYQYPQTHWSTSPAPYILAVLSVWAQGLLMTLKSKPCLSGISFRKPSILQDVLQQKLVYGSLYALSQQHQTSCSLQSAGNLPRALVLWWSPNQLTLQHDGWCMSALQSEL